MTPAPRPRTGQPGGVRATVGMLVLLPVLMLVLAVLLVWLAEREANRNSEERVSVAAHVSAANAHVLVTSTLERLARLDEALGPNPAAFRPPPAGQGFLFMGLYDAAGNTLTAGGARGANVATNADFQALAKGRPWQITPLIGANQSLHLFGIGKRLERNGKFVGVMTAFLPADALAELWRTVALGPDSTLTLLREDGQLITRYPIPDHGFDLSKDELFTTRLPKAAAGFYQTSAWPIDGQPRTIGYEAIKDFGIVAIATISRAAVAEGFWSRVWSISLFAAPAFIALAFLCAWTGLLLLRQERSRRELAAAVAQNRVLFQEIHHRVKNNLQAVAALVRLQAAPPAMKEDLIRRIAAITAVHQHMYESDHFGDLDASAYLAKLLTSIKDSAPPGVELDWTLESVELSPDQALPLGLIVNEVVSNAFKHAFPQGRAGKVSVTLARLDGQKQAKLVIADNGVGMPEAAAPGGVGLGTRLIASLVKQLDGKSTVQRNGGISFDLRFPVGK